MKRDFVSDYWHDGLIEADCEYDDEDAFFDDPCFKCGPWCEHWMEDSLCKLDLENLEHEQQYFFDKYASIERCPVCGKVLEQFQIPADELWVWPGIWNEEGEYYDPRICVFNVYGVYGIPKDVMHSDRNVYHIWTSRKYNQKLIKLMSSNKPETKRDTNEETQE